jgi:hypothetical protein
MPPEGSADLLARLRQGQDHERGTKLRLTQIRYAPGRICHRSRPQPAREGAELYGEQHAELVRSDLR